MQKRICELVINSDKITKTQIDNVLKLKKNVIQNYSYILHDKDVYLDEKEAIKNNKIKGGYKNPHWHIMLRFNKPQQFRYIAKWFNTKENFVSKIKGRFTDALKYLIHSNAPEKHQYKESDVVSNFDWKKEIENNDFNRKYKIDNRLQEIILQIEAGEIKEYNITKHVNIIENNIYSAAIERAFKYRINTLKGIKREMECVFITGLSGSGKTTLAKKIANDKKYNTYISSGSNDVLDDYQGQECIILDDLRPHCLGLSDLLKMLDNNTASSVKSRYKNKVLECKLIVITTVKDIDSFFDEVFLKKEERESIIQLKRRCRFHITLDSKKIKYDIWNPVDKKYDLVREFKNNLLTKYQIKKLSIREAEILYKNICNINMD